MWGSSGQATWTTANAWLGLDGWEPSVPTVAQLERLVTRYLGAFGPASVRDVQVWSGLTRLAEVVSGLRRDGRLREFRGEDGAVLFDLPDAARPEAETPAPVRFLAAYDNLLLSYDDRRRFSPEQRRVPLPPGGGATSGSLLVDGTWRGGWRLARQSADALLSVQPFDRLGAAERDAIAAEGQQLVTFVAGDVTAIDSVVEVAVAPPG